MMKNFKPLLLYVLFTSVFLIGTSVKAQRDPLKWPFSKTSIWNMPIHEDAQYVDAKINAPSQGFHVDENILILTPNEPAVNIYTNYAGWNRDKARCLQQGPLLFSAPIPSDFKYSSNEWLGLTPNSAAAILMSDGTTIRQTQPFSKCVSGGTATSQYIFTNADLYGDGRPGAHGASALSSIGGTIRLGELVPGGKIQHALKLEIYAARFLYYNETTKGYRWPAYRADGYAKDVYGTKGTPEPECRMGSLLALPSDLSINDLDLQTEPAKIIAEALQNYGGYIVDDTAWDTYYFCVEHSPEGKVREEFASEWGFPIESANGTPWAKDMEKIFTSLHVVVNNTVNTIGGGSNTEFENRLAPMACDFDEPGSGSMCSFFPDNGGIEPYNIMPLGNSITEAADPGFRGYLYKNLVDAGFDIDFVGSKHVGMPSNGGDPDHSGFGGFVIGPGPSKGDDWDQWKHGDILYHLDNGFKVMENGADIILLEIGINDFFNDRDDYDPNVVGANRLDSLIQKIYDIDSTVVLMVANITPVGWSSTFASIFNSGVPGIISKYKTLGRNCYLVDLRNGIEWDMQKDFQDDQLHPSASGAEKIAIKFFEELTPVLDSMNGTTGGIVPQIKFNIHDNQSEYTEPASILLEAQASDEDGFVRKVIFYKGNVKLGEDATAPYRFEWNNVLAGDYWIRAVVIDNDGNKVASESIPIIVKAGSGDVYLEDFDDDLAQDWKALSGVWSVQNKAYRLPEGTGEYISVFNKQSFVNYTYTAKAKPDWNNNFGLVFNYQDNQNYYLLSLDASPLTAWLMVIKGGNEKIIKSNTYTNGGTGVYNSIQIDNINGKTTIAVNGETIFDNVVTTDFTSGRIGVYSWYNPVEFDEIKVVGIDVGTGLAITQKSPTLKIYPNPLNQDSLIIQLDEMVATIQFSIYDMNGKLVCQKVEQQNNLFKIEELKDATPGIYLLTTKSDGISYQNKIIVH